MRLLHGTMREEYVKITLIHRTIRCPPKNFYSEKKERKKEKISSSPCRYLSNGDRFQ